MSVTSEMKFHSETNLHNFMNNLPKAQYVRIRGREKRKGGVELVTFICRRSRESQHHAENRFERLIRTHRSVKLEENCLSRLRCLVQPDGTVMVTFFHRHTGHDPETDHYNTLRLGDAVISTIDRMILDGVPALRIMKDLSAALRDRDTREEAWQVCSVNWYISAFVRLSQFCYEVGRSFHVRSKGGYPQSNAKTGIISRKEPR